MAIVYNLRCVLDSHVECLAHSNNAVFHLLGEVAALIAGRGEDQNGLIRMG